MIEEKITIRKQLEGYQHELGVFSPTPAGDGAVAECSRCGGWVVVDPVGGIQLDEWIEGVCKGKGMNKLYTVGYTGRKPVELKLLIEEYDAVLVDIRYSPRSRVPHWGGVHLEGYLPAGRYVWAKALGNAGYKNGHIRILAMGAGAEQIAHIMEERSVILMCACKDVDRCHRLVVADELASRYGWPVEHL